MYIGPISAGAVDHRCKQRKTRVRLAGPEKRKKGRVMKHTNEICRERKRNFLGLPWTFTIYSMNDTRLFIETGFFTKAENEVRLYRILDLSLTRNLWQRLIRTGTIHVTSADRTMKNFDIKNIKKPHEVNEMLSEYVENARRENRVYARESMHSQGEIDIHGEGPEFEFNPDAFDDDPMNPDPDPDHGGDGDLF